MKVHPLLGLIAAAMALPVYAQQSETPASGENTPAASAARDALKKQEGDADQTAMLKQTLTAVDKQYSLLKRGKLQATYDFNYSYVGQEVIDANVDQNTGELTLFNIQNDSSHTITNTVSVDYGVRDNLTANLIVPVLSKYSENPAYDGFSHSVGDLGLGARWQPIEVRRGRPSMTFTGNVRLPTGKSPFKVVAGQGLATGSGVTTFTGGINMNHIADPVALFGSVNVSYSLSANDLHQRRGTRFLTKVEPGMSLGFGIGFAYALSYGITTSVSLQESISAGTKLHFADGTSGKTKTQTSGVLNFGLGYRVSPKTTVNVTAGVGLTDDSPNFSLGVSLPLAF